jgi:hypothetical protein
MKITSNKKGAFALGALINKTKADIIKYCGEPTGPFKEWHGGGGYSSLNTYFPTTLIQIT